MNINLKIKTIFLNINLFLKNSSIGAKVVIATVLGFFIGFTFYYIETLNILIFSWNDNFGVNIVQEAYYNTTNGNDTFGNPKLYNRPPNDPNGAHNPYRTLNLAMINQHTEEERNAWLSRANRAALLAGMTFGVTIWCINYIMYAFGGDTI